jgi:hypothetical protein
MILKEHSLISAWWLFLYQSSSCHHPLLHRAWVLLNLEIMVLLKPIEMWIPLSGVLQHRLSRRYALLRWQRLVLFVILLPKNLD